MNNRERMYQSNIKARKWLIDNNFKDIHLFPHTRFSLDVHFQGLSFDGCASFGKRFVLFQIKTNCKPTKKVQEQMKIVSKESNIIILWYNVILRKPIEVYGLKEKDLNSTNNI